ncbi:malate dehydrogenase [Quercus suber]|uniref:malate dehydrogenase n=1 Tax=Quercus suber TaxID=58331 RepID=A0AAW0J320_QUESU
MAGLKIDEYLRAMMDAIAKELIEEKSLAKSCLEYVRRLDSFEKKSTRNCLLINLVFEKMEYLVLLQNGLVVLLTIAFSWKLITYMWGSVKMEKEPMKVLVTSTAGMLAQPNSLFGQIGYAIAPMIARGIMLGPDQPVILHLLDIALAAEALNGVKMELLDAAFPLLKEVHATTDITKACKDVNIAIMLVGFPHKEGMERKDMMSKNVPIYKEQASALEEHAASDCKYIPCLAIISCPYSLAWSIASISSNGSVACLLASPLTITCFVVANPANTNALILKEFAPSIPKKNITCITRLDHNRALSQIAERLKVYFTDVKNVIIWGNHSSTQYPDANHATVTTTNGERLYLKISNMLKNEFINTVQKRGAAIIKARKAPSALFATSAACDHMRDWVLRTPKGTWVSMGVYFDGSYGIPKDIIYSFPVKCEKGKWSIVKGLKIDEFLRAKMDATAKDLIDENEVAHSCLN